MSQSTIPVLFQAMFKSTAGWNSSDGYASIELNRSSGNSPPASGSGNPCHFVAVFPRDDPGKGAVYQQVCNSSTDVPAGLDQYLDDQHILFWASAAFVTQMPQGNLYTMLDANGGGSKLRQMEMLATAFACGVNSGMVYLMASVPGTGMNGIELLKIRESSTGGPASGGTQVYSAQVLHFMLLLELIPSSTGLYTPVELH